MGAVAPEHLRVALPLAVESIADGVAQRIADAAGEAEEPGRGARYGLHVLSLPAVDR